MAISLSTEQGVIVKKVEAIDDAGCFQILNALDLNWFVMRLLEGRVELKDVEVVSGTTSEDFLANDLQTEY